MRKLVAATVLVMLVAFGFASSARADTILFTGPAFSGLNGQHTWHINSDGIGMQFTATASPFSATMKQNSEGIGVDSWVPFEDPGEIGWAEMLSIAFDTPTMLAGFNVKQLYYEWPQGQEYGLYSINGGSWVQFPSSGTTSGDYTVSFLPSTVSSIDFGVGLNRPLDDYSVAGINTVPEPSSMLLLGCGLIGLARAVCRRTKK